MNQTEQYTNPDEIEPVLKADSTERLKDLPQTLEMLKLQSVYENRKYHEDVQQVKNAVDYLVSSDEVVEAIHTHLIPTGWVNDFIDPPASKLDDVTIFLYDLFYIFEEYATPSIWIERR